jgi:hypothetical protein
MAGMNVQAQLRVLIGKTRTDTKVQEVLATHYSSTRSDEKLRIGRQVRRRT